MDYSRNTFPETTGSTLVRHHGAADGATLLRAHPPHPQSGRSLLSQFPYPMTTPRKRSAAGQQCNVLLVQLKSQLTKPSPVNAAQIKRPVWILYTYTREAKATTRRCNNRACGIQDRRVAAMNACCSGAPCPAWMCAGATRRCELPQTCLSYDSAPFLTWTRAEAQSVKDKACH